MKFVSFTHDLCEELLNKGYSYFVMPNHDEANMPFNELTTLKAVRNKPHEKAIPIKQIMDLPSETARKYFVMYNDD